MSWQEDGSILYEIKTLPQNKLLKIFSRLYITYKSEIHSNILCNRNAKQMKMNGNTHCYRNYVDIKHVYLTTVSPLAIYLYGFRFVRIYAKQCD